MTQLYPVFESHSEEIIQKLIDRLRRELPPYAALSLEEVRRRVEAGIWPFARDLDREQPVDFPEYWAKTSYQRAQQGVPIESFMRVLTIANEEVIRGMKDVFGQEPAQQVEVIEKSYRIANQAVTSVYLGYQSFKDQVISSQESALAEISTPIIPVYEGILVLPVVGSIDSNRAGQIMESLLENINNQSANVVILDITGVPVIDTGVANYLLQAARAARLLGSDVVLVGIGPEIAQTIVQLGIDLTGITTRANLQAGIEYALAKRGLAIRRA